MNPDIIPEFGIKREGEERRDGGIGIVFDPVSRRYAVAKQHEDGAFRLYSGGIDPGEDIQLGTLREVTEESGLYDFLHIEKIGEVFAHYYNILRKVNRVTHATCFLIILKSTNRRPVELEEHEKFSLVWATAGEIVADLNSRNANKDYDHWLYLMKKAAKKLEELGYSKAG